MQRGSFGWGVVGGVGPGAGKNIMGGKGDPRQGSDPKAAALVTLGINIGNKNLRSLPRSIYELYNVRPQRPPYLETNSGRGGGGGGAFPIQKIMLQNLDL